MTENARLEDENGKLEEWNSKLGEENAQLEAETSLAARIMDRATGQCEHGPAHVQAAHAQHTQTGTIARVRSGAPVKKEAKHHRRCASL